MNLDAIKNLQPLHRNLAGGAIVLLVLVLVIFGIIQPKQANLSTLNEEISGLNSEVTIYQEKVKRLDQLIQENRRLVELLEEQKRQLPEDYQIASLVKQVTDAGARTGLTFKFWRPTTPVTDASGLYQRLPVQVEVSGGYHQLALFFEQVSYLTRIVNISEVNITPSRPGSSILTATFMATAFAAPEKPIPGEEDEKAGKRRKKKK